jgi:acyl-CoA oxidase
LEGWFAADAQIAAFSVWTSSIDRSTLMDNFQRRQRAASLVVTATEKILAAGKGEAHFEGAPWNDNTVTLIRAAKSHLQLVLFQTFASSVNEMEGTAAPQTVRVLRRLVTLFGLGQMLSNMGDFLESGFLTPSQAGMAREAQYQVLKELRPDAVGLVDSFAIPDYVLDSSLGRFDGDVYRDLLERAQLSPLNDTEEGPAWTGVLDRVLKPAPNSRL